MFHAASCIESICREGSIDKNLSKSLGGCFLIAVIRWYENIFFHSQHWILGSMQPPSSRSYHRNRLQNERKNIPPHIYRKCYSFLKSSTYTSVLLHDFPSCSSVYCRNHVKPPKTHSFPVLHNHYLLIRRLESSSNLKTKWNSADCFSNF